MRESFIECLILQLKIRSPNLKIPLFSVTKLAISMYIFQEGSSFQKSSGSKSRARSQHYSIRHLFTDRECRNGMSSLVSDR